MRRRSGCRRGGCALSFRMDQVDLSEANFRNLKFVGIKKFR